MKVLLVDDEKHVREGMKLLGAWEQNGVDDILEAGNGEEAVRLIEEFRPEIIFTDMKMPRMDGTRLLEWMKENAPTSKTIVVTGYDDYHFMRKAIHFGSFDYLLKPIDPEILNETLEKVVNEWKKEEAQRQTHMSSHQLINEMKPVYRDRKLTQLMNSDIATEDLYEMFGFHLSGHYNIGLVRVNGKTIESFHGDRDLAYFTILNVINEILMQKQCGIGFRYLSNKGEIVIIFWDQLDKVAEQLVMIYETIKKALNVSCSIALGKPVQSSAKLQESYLHAKQLLVHQNVLEEKNVRVYLQESTPEPPLKSLMAYSSNIELAVQTGELRAFEELTRQIVAEYTENHYYTHSSRFARGTKRNEICFVP
ncbi:response regulator [Neobacillus sp. SM06]|uniref:response regulator n=1 Tax=Neobacillus sp. SM06 TaxID=3422492 RepID=UPI003D281527